MNKDTTPAADRPVATNKILVAATAVALVASLAALGHTILGDHPRIGIVRIQKVLERYEGALDAKKAFRTTTMAWGANVDTLQADINRIILEIERVRSTDRRAYDSLVAQVRLKEAQLMDYRKAVEAKTTQEQQILTEGVVAQLKTAAEEVAKSENVDCMLAIHDEGMIIQASKTVDMTDVVLEKLRGTYRGQFRSPGGGAKPGQRSPEGAK
jgi:Skp family chaperone for outer membrane proteins